MSEKIDISAAEAVIENAVRMSTEPKTRTQKEFVEWSRQVREFSELCASKNLKSYIAVLGNAMLAKATNPRIDAYSLKAGDKSGGAYDARRPAEKVLVPASQMHRFSLGTSGPQPLNNQPFFGRYRIDTELRIKPNAKPVLNALLKLLHEIQQYKTEEATRALAAFIDVRRGYIPRYDVPRGNIAIGTREELASAIEMFVSKKSEGGGRAQACAGGLFDALFSQERVRVGKKNEPDRKAPGDVGVRKSADTESPLIRIYEVRDKNVPTHAAVAFIAKVATAGLSRAGLLAVASDQEVLNKEHLRHRARENGVDLEIFTEWRELVAAIVFAAEGRETPTIEVAAAAIRSRIEALELSEDAASYWDELTLLPSTS